MEFRKDKEREFHNYICSEKLRFLGDYKHCTSNEIFYSIK